MKINRENFDENFLQRFSTKIQQYIIDFCNTFQNAFPNILDVDTMIEKISILSEISEVNAVQGEGNGIFDHWTYSISYKSGFSELDERNIIYHELLHLLSLQFENGKAIFAGLNNFDGSGDWIIGDTTFDEIMNEFYTVKMLEIEKSLQKKEYTLKKDPMYEFYPIKEITRYYGNGYINKVQLAELYDKMFGEELLKAKICNGKSFRESFNKKYSSLDIEVKEGEDIPPSDELTPYEKVQYQMGQNNIYSNFEVAIDIWLINQKENISKNGFNLYDYWKDTNELMKYLPIREDKTGYKSDRSNQGIPDNLFDKISEIDRYIICKYIRPDFMQIEDEYTKTRKINTILAVINILRENIRDLSAQDISLVSYGKVAEYTHSGTDCLVINANNNQFMTFVNNSIEPNYQFREYCKFRRLTEFQDFEYTEKDEDEVRNILKESGYDIDEFTYSRVKAGGQHPMWILIESEGKYYTGSGIVKQVRLQDIQTFGINPSQIRAVLETKNMSLEEISSITANIRGNVSKEDSNVR